MRRGSVLILLAMAGTAHAQLDPGTAARDGAPPLNADDATCLKLDTTPGALLEGAQPSGALSAPIPWTEFAVEGELLETTQTVHGLLEPTFLQYRTSLSDAKWADIAKMTARFGYQLAGHRIEGTKVVVRLAPLPMVEKVSVDVDRSNFFDKQLDDEIVRRMRLRSASYLPWENVRRECALIEERKRIEEYLHDEGYFDAVVGIVPSVDGAKIKLRVDVNLGDEYVLGRIEIPKQVNGEPLAISDAEIKAPFVHKQICIIGNVCIFSARFTRTHLQEDLQKVKDKFHTRGFPGVRVQTNFDPRTSFDRRTHKVNIAITIDQRRQLDVQFEGQNGAASIDELRAQLTFDKAGSADDVEAAQSAHAIMTFLQQRGFFDARVTWQRERFETRATALDSIVFQIELGNQREVTSIEFVGNKAKGFETKALLDVIATKEATLNLQSALFGGAAAASSEQLAIDVDRIKEAYRRAGYREARVSVTASPIPSGLDSAALTAPLVAASYGSQIYVRFTIDEGEPTVLSELEITQQGNGDRLDGELCAQMLRELAIELAEPQLAIRTDNARCSARTATLKFREDDVAATRDRLRDWMFKIGRPRAVVEYTATEAGVREIAAHFTVSRVEPMKLGKILIRGNFKTRPSVIFSEVGLHEGDKLTADALADGARRLRNTGLFDAVNIDLPEIENRDNTSPIVNAVIRVEERYNHLSEIELATGYSSLNGLFGTFKWTQRNLFGLGMAWGVSFTYGTKITDLESTFTIPPWIVRPYSPFEFRTELTGLYRQQDDPRFGQLTTEGASFIVSPLLRDWQRPRTNAHSARAVNLAFHLWDFRVRSRNVDALRPIGADLDQSQVAISTRSGSFGVTAEWEQRVDRHGSLAPLSPEDGFHLQGSIAYYAPFLLGQDTFLKVSLAASRFIPFGDNLVIRGDVRYDEGFPLRGAALLPEVERFFAGGDSTVRGYNDDRMATEVIRVPVPPLDNVTQIRIIPAGGNIRMLASVDAQLRIWSIFAGALFSDAGMIANQWSSVKTDSIRPSVGTGIRLLTPFGIGAVEYAVPLQLQLGDDPRGRLHIYFAARAQF